MPKALGVFFRHECTGLFQSRRSSIYLAAMPPCVWCKHPFGNMNALRKHYQSCVLRGVQRVLPEEVVGAAGQSGATASHHGDGQSWALAEEQSPSRHVMSGEVPMGFSCFSSGSAHWLLARRGFLSGPSSIEEPRKVCYSR